MGIEPTTDIVCPPLDLKSRRPTRTCPLPSKSLIDSPFKVKMFQMFLILIGNRQIVTLRIWSGQDILLSLSEGKGHYGMTSPMDSVDRSPLNIKQAIDRERTSTPTIPITNKTLPS
jgi:hypothetical protein